MSTTTAEKEYLQQKYAAKADCADAGYEGESVAEIHARLQSFGYARSDYEGLPLEVLAHFGVGRPLYLGDLKAGDSVVDLGCGRGLDVLLAAKAVGPSGRVRGYDMTPALVEKARASAVESGLSHAEFHVCDIERLPLSDGAVDVVMSNCVITLIREKEEVYAEAFRVLRPGGRLIVSDLVSSAPLPEEIRRDYGPETGIPTTLEKSAYFEMIGRVGFRDVQIRRESVWRPEQQSQWRTAETRPVPPEYEILAVRFVAVRPATP